MEYQPGFTVTERGFRITFENGYTISVVFVWGNYCDNYDEKKTNLFGGLRHIEGYLSAFPDFKRSDSPAFIHCPNAEIAVFDPAGCWVTEKVCNDAGIECCGDVVGYIAPEDFLKMCICISNYKFAAKIENEKD